jgi:hypothetical protein
MPQNLQIMSKTYPTKKGQKFKAPDAGIIGSATVASFALNVFNSNLASTFGVKLVAELPNPDANHSQTWVNTTGGKAVPLYACKKL